MSSLKELPPGHSASKRSMIDEKTIAAISTPIGEAGIGIVRLSGPLSEPISKKIFRSKKENPHLTSHLFHYGEIIDPATGALIDEVLLVLMKSPKTYTREDVAEIHCHGGSLILQRILELVLRQGARLAQPGEFTKRAFLNGRIDLTQAEAVIDVIRARTTASLEIANRQLRGSFHEKVIAVKERLIEPLALIEAHIDFPEEEIDPICKGRIEGLLRTIVEEVEKWINTYEEGRILREGISCAIIGKPNVGKSSLLNVLLNEERAIVTAIPGTTRDVIEETLNIKGIAVRLMDTAGLRRTEDSVEKEGVRRTKEHVSSADFIILVLDGSTRFDADDLEIIDEIQTKKKVIVVNKEDLPQRITMEDIRKKFPSDPIIVVSALMRKGIDDLRLAVYNSLIRNDLRGEDGSLILANLRHKIALEEAKERLSAAISGVRDDISIEFIAFEIRCALESLAEMVGETTTEKVLDLIFEQFCIGK